jgi:tRNA pseudouridine13 synthase
MKLKSKPGDFVVREILRDGFLRSRGRFRVYRVTKRKYTSLEAASFLARHAGVDGGEIGLAGLKDRQGITTQFMSVPGGKIVRWRSPEISIEFAGFSAEALTSRHSEGNDFEVTVRDLPREAEPRVEAAIAAVRDHGLVNYFGEQRFGNLLSGQGWIARDLALGKHERALRNLLGAGSERDDDRNRRFKAALDSRWGDWRACREIAGVFGAHHSVFEHLARHPGDFAGAFRRIAPKLRLIHLYAWQSHVWNRAVARYVEEITPPRDRIAVPSPEGRLVHARGAMAVDPAMQGTFRLPGPGLEDVVHPRQRELLAQALSLEGLRPEDFRIEGVPGFHLKGEDRALALRPRDLRATRTPRGLRLSFALPRGGYALLVVQRLLADVRPRTAPSRGPRHARPKPHRSRK